MAENESRVILTATDRTQQAFASVRASLAGLGQNLGAFQASLAGLGVGVGVGALVGAFKQTTSEMARLDDAAEQTGASVESLSSLLNTLKPSGVGLEQITDVAGKLTKSMAGAGEGGKRAAEAFQALGVSTKDTAGNLRPVDEVLKELADSLSQYADGSNKVALAQALLGKAGAQYLPLLKDLAETQRVAGTVSAEQAAAAEKLEKSLGKLAVAVNALKVDAFSGLIEKLAAFGDKLVEVASKAGSFQQAMVALLGRGTVDDRIQQEIDQIKRLAAIRQEYVAGTRTTVQKLRDIAANEDSVELIDKKLRAATSSLNALRAVVRVSQREDSALKAQEDRGFKPTAGEAPRISAAGVAGARTSVSEAERLLETLNKQLDTTKKLSKEQEVLGAIGRGEVSGLNAALEQQILLRAVQIDKVEEAARALSLLVKQEGDRQRIEDEATSAYKRANDELDRQASAWRDQITPAREYLRQLEAINEQEKIYARDPGRGMSPFEAQVARGVLEAKNAPGEVTDEVKELDDAARQLGLTMSSAFEDAVVGGKDLREVLKGLGQDIARIALRKLVTERLAGFITGLIPKASGGSVFGGTPYLVGERGPEMFVPAGNGTIVPNGAGGVAITQNISVASGATRGEVLTAMYQAKEAAKAEIMQSMRRGGAFA